MYKIYFNNPIVVLLVQLGQTLLHYAAYYGNYDVVRILLENNADVDAADKVGVNNNNQDVIEEKSGKTLG